MIYTDENSEQEEVNNENDGNVLNRMPNDIHLDEKKKQSALMSPEFHPQEQRVLNEMPSLTDTEKYHQVIHGSRLNKDLLDNRFTFS